MGVRKLQWQGTWVSVLCQRMGSTFYQRYCVSLSVIDLIGLFVFIIYAGYTICEVDNSVEDVNYWQKGVYPFHILSFWTEYLELW